MVVVEAEGGAGGCWDGVAGHEGLGAVVASADSDAMVVGKGCDVVGVDVVDYEGHDAGLVCGSAEEAEVRDF